MALLRGETLCEVKMSVKREMDSTVFVILGSGAVATCTDPIQADLLVIRNPFHKITRVAGFDSCFRFHRDYLLKNSCTIRQPLDYCIEQTIVA